MIAVAGKEQMQAFSHVFTSHTASKLNDGHLWFSVFNRPPQTRFTRVQRVLCCMMILWLEMMVNIMWYTVRPPPEAARKINIGPFSVSPAQVYALIMIMSSIQTGARIVCNVGIHTGFLHYFTSGSIIQRLSKCV